MSRFRLVSVAVLSLLVMAVGASAAAAAAAPFATNGQVSSMARSGDTLYLGGDFTRAGPRTGSGVSLDQASGDSDPSFPTVVGNVNATVSDGSGGWYIGGAFSSVGGVARARLAHILPGGAVDLSWNPGANSSWSLGAGSGVHALAISGSTVYAGGTFTNVGGQPRQGLAAIDATTGEATTANLDVNGRVNALAASASGSTVYVGGTFTTVGGQGRTNLAAIDATTGALTGWSPSANRVHALAVSASGSTVYTGGAQLSAYDAATGSRSWNLGLHPLSPVESVLALAVSGSTVYAGGTFTQVGGQTRVRLAAVNATNGTLTAWNPAASGAVAALAVSGSRVYVGGDFSYMSNRPRDNLAAFDTTTGSLTAWESYADRPVSALAVSGATVYAGGKFTFAGGTTRNRLAAFDVPTGTLKTWNPNPDGGVYVLAASGSTVYAGGYFSTVGGQPRAGLAAIDADSGDSTAWNPNVGGEVYALAVSGSTVYAGGSFSSVGGEPRNGLAAIDAATGNPTPWSADFAGYVSSLAVSGSTVYVSGEFSTEGGASSSGLEAIDATTGTVTWNAVVNGWVGALAVSGSTVYAGGSFASVGGQSRNNLAAVDAATGTPTAWNPNVTGISYYGGGPFVSAVAVSGSTVYAGGAFSDVGGQGGYNISAIDATTGRRTTWDPYVEGEVRALSVVPSETTLYAGGTLFTYQLEPRGGVLGLDRGDTTPPAVSIASPVDGSAFAVGASRTVDFACADATASCTGRLDGSTDVADGDPLPTGAEGPHTLVVTSTDPTGNTATESATYVVDGTDPTAEISSPTAGQAVAKGAALTAEFACADTGGSGVDTCVGRLDGTTDVADGDALPTGVEASHTLVVTATDELGRTATDTVSYTVGDAPGISGRPTMSAPQWASGQLVTAHRGDWTNDPTGYAYAWYRCLDTGCGPIAGATASTYELRAADGNRRIRVRVTATNGAGSTARFSDLSPLIGIPVVQTAPTLEAGPTRTGDELTVDPGTWSPEQTGFDVVWLRCGTLYLNSCTPIATDTDDNTRYTLTNDDDAKRIRARVTAVNDAGSSVPATTKPTVLIDTPTLVAPPVLRTTTAIVGTPLRTGDGEWTGDPTRYTYEWLRCTGLYLDSCTRLTSSDATDNDDAYTPTNGDVGNRIRSRVRAHNPSGSAPRGSTSAISRKVVAAPGG